PLSIRPCSAPWCPCGWRPLGSRWPTGRFAARASRAKTNATDRGGVMAPRMLHRWACVNVPALPLQLLLQRHPAWRDEPVAVVAEDRPQGAIAWVNGRARRAGLAPGMRYATGLSLAPRLRAGVLSPAEITASVEMLSTRLHDFTPGVEASGSEP